MSKSQGLKIGVEFTEDLIGDILVPSNAPAFTINWQEPLWVDKQIGGVGSLVDKSYNPSTVEPYAPILSTDILSVGTLTDTAYSGSDIRLKNTVGEVGEWGEPAAQSGSVSNIYNIVEFKIKCTLASVQFMSWNSGNCSVSVKSEDGSIVYHTVTQWVNGWQWYNYPMPEISVNVGTKLKIVVVQPYGPARIQTSALNKTYFKSNGCDAGGGFWADFSLAIGLIMHTSNYALSGERVSLPISLVDKPNKIVMTWLSTIVPGTALGVKTAVTSETNGVPDTPGVSDWVDQQNNSLISNIPSGSLVGKHLWMKQQLSTNSSSDTPKLLSLMITQAPDPKKILLSMDLSKRFNNVFGNIHIAYSASNGTLQGAGGIVESFSYEFSPTELIEELPERWYQNENVLATTSSFLINISKVLYLPGYLRENISFSINNYSIVVTKVGSNPL